MAETKKNNENVNEKTIELDEQIKELALENASLKALMMQVLDKVNDVSPIHYGNKNVRVEQAANEFLDMVPIFLFKDDNQYRDDYFVQVNGRRYKIQRGETVYVPKPVAEVVEHSEKQDKLSAKLVEQLVKNYEASTRS